MIPMSKIKLMTDLYEKDRQYTNYQTVMKDPNTTIPKPKYNKPVPTFEKCEIGDYVKFKAIKQNVKEKMKTGVFVTDKYSSYYGVVVDVSKPGYLGLNIDQKDKRMDYPVGITIWIDRRAVLQIYPSEIVKQITPRIALKHLWKNLVFREIKTTKCRGMKYAQYNYISKSGFERQKRFPNLDEALRNVDHRHHKNITVHYDEYYGFTYDKALRNNDKYFDREIFFSKKCYCELDFNDKNPTGDFLINERGFNDIPSRPGSLICGLVENGEKGLFFRKWFVCSREFLLLWTMVCYPKDPSLMEDSTSFEHFSNESETRNVKNLDKLLFELSTSDYQPNLSLDIHDRQQRYIFRNLERTALFYPNRYQRICNVLFSKGFLTKSEEDSRSYSEDYQDDYTPFQKKLVKNLIWAKNLC